MAELCPLKDISGGPTSTNNLCCLFFLLIMGHRKAHSTKLPPSVISSLSGLRSQACGPRPFSEEKVLGTRKEVKIQDSSFDNEDTMDA